MKLSDKTSYNILAIMRGTTVDGPGFRTSIYIAGCRHKCPGCHNPSSWGFNSGETMSLDQILSIVDEEDFDVTLSGGDPLYNPGNIAILVKSLVANRRKVLIYTGFTWEEFMADASLTEAVRLAEVVVDGPFIEHLKDPDLLFRGSSNKRLIDVRQSLLLNKVVIFKE